MSKSLNQTDKNDKDNRGEKTENELFELVRPLWQGWRDSNPRPLVLETNALAN